MNGEMEAHFEELQEPNRKSGKGRKQVKTPVGQIEIETLTGAGLPTCCQMLLEFEMGVICCDVGS